jgi:hypothetical protein
VLAHAELDADRPRRERLRDQLAAEAKKVDAALDRYFDSFETGALSAESCGPSSTYPQFDHLADQCPRHESNMRTRFRKLLTSSEKCLHLWWL